MEETTAEQCKGHTLFATKGQGMHVCKTDLLMNTAGGLRLAISWNRHLLFMFTSFLTLQECGPSCLLGLIWRI